MSVVNHRGWYHYDPDTQTLWIVPPKCGSTSFVTYFPDFVKYEGMDAHPWTTCRMIVRHPWQRIVSALSMMELPLATESAILMQNNIHLKPYHKLINGREVDIIKLENIKNEFPDYPHEHKRNSVTWRNASIDWVTLLPSYEEDFEKCQYEL